MTKTKNAAPDALTLAENAFIDCAVRVAQLRLARLGELAVDGARTDEAAELLREVIDSIHHAKQRKVFG